MSKLVDQSELARAPKNEPHSEERNSLLLSAERPPSEESVTRPLVVSTSGKEYLSGPPDNWTPQNGFMNTFCCCLRPSMCLFQKLGKLFGGRFKREPEEVLGKSPRDETDGAVPGESPPECTLSPSTQAMLRERVFHDLDPADVLDYHVHIVGHGDGGSRCSIHNNMKSWLHPINRLKAAVFMAAAQCPDEDGGDRQYVSRLVRLVKHFVPNSVLYSEATSSVAPDELFRHNKLCLLAFDAFYNKDTGEVNRDNTTLYVPNEYAYHLANEFPDYFYAVGSVNPYRDDAIKELEKCAENGVTIIKWLPNSMGIDLRDQKCIPFYRKMKELDMALLVHVGDEHSVDAAYIDNTLGNPLFLRSPLTNGVRVIAAHCATEGYSVDFDDPTRQKRSCFELFMRLMKTEGFKDLLFADISAVTAFKRVKYLKLLMEETEIHDRLVYGSDYPVPAINIVVHTSKLVSAGLILEEEKVALNELYNFNPLLFDLACKRLVKSAAGEGFPTEVFKEHPLLPPKRTVAFKRRESISGRTLYTTNTDSMTYEDVPEDTEEQEEQSSSPHPGRREVQVVVEVHHDTSEHYPPVTTSASPDIVLDTSDNDSEQSRLLP